MRDLRNVEHLLLFEIQDVRYIASYRLKGALKAFVIFARGLMLISVLSNVPKLQGSRLGG